MSDKKLELTRRRMLAGIGIIGAASAGAGAGTMALFSDTETSEENTVKAGTLDLELNGKNVSTFSLEGVKPGENSTEVISLSNAGSIGGYLNVGLAVTSDAENGLEEPEPSDDTTESGELAEEIDVNLGFDTTGDGAIDELVASSESGVLDLHGVTYNANYELDAAGGDNDTVDFTFAWAIPEEVGNEIQGDSVTLDFSFELFQQPADGDIVLSGDSIYGRGGGFEYAWDTTTDVASIGSGAWGTVARSSDDYKQGFYFAGSWMPADPLEDYLVSDIAEISYSLYESAPLEGNDIYLNIYTKPEDDGEDTDSWYDTRLQALPAEANGGSPDFTPAEWNEFSTSAGASNQLNFYDSGRATQFGGSINKPEAEDQPTLSDLQSGDVDWSNYGTDAADSPYSYHDETVMTLSLQTNSTSPQLEAYVDDIAVRLTDGTSVTYDLEP